MTLVLAQPDPLQLTRKLEDCKSLISQWLDQRKVAYTPAEMGQFREYSSEVLARIQRDVADLAKLKIDQIKKDKDREIAARVFPKKSLLFFGIAEGGACIGSGGSCTAIAATATAPFLILAAGLSGIISVYALGKLSYQTINDSLPANMNKKTDFNAKKKQEDVLRACKALHFELGKLQAEMTLAEKKCEVSTLQCANANTRRVQHRAQQRQLRDLRQQYTSAKSQVTRLGRANREIDEKLQKTSEKMVNLNQDLNEKITVQERATTQLEATVIQLRQSNETTAADLARLRDENASNLANAQRANLAAERTEAAAEELRSTHADTLARIERAHQRNFEILLRTLEENNPDRPPRLSYQESRRREEQLQNPPFQPQRNRDGLLDELNLAEELPNGDFIAVEWENGSQQSDEDDGNQAYQPDLQNWAADVRVEMMGQ